MSDIIRFRGDTTVIRRTIKNDAGAVLNIAGWTIWLTINAEARPADTTNQIAQMPGVITDAPNGVVEFSPDAVDVDYVGTYFFDIQAVDASGVVSTLNHARFIFLQDIMKSNPGQIWTPNGVTGERWTDWEDSSGPFRGFMDCSDDTENWWEFQVRGGVPVVRWSGATTGTWLTLEFAGDQAVGGVWGPTGVWEFTGLMYWAPGCRLLLLSNFYDVCLTLMSVASDRMRLECESYHPYGYDDYYENVNFFHTTRTVEEWVAYRWRMDCDTPQVSGKIWYPADPANWEADEPGAWNGQVGLATAPLRTRLPVRFQFQGGSAATLCEIARIGWERLS